MLKQKGKWTWTWTKGKCEKGASIKKERKSCTHIHIICKQKEWNAWEVHNKICCENVII
jgi:hypothetical protein